MTLDEFFDGRDHARTIFERLRSTLEALGPCVVRVSRSQVSFRHHKPFAWAWTPDRYLRGKHLAPLVLSISVRDRIESPRWKEVAEPVPGRFMHHLELNSADDIDFEVVKWLEQARSEAE